MGTRSEAPPSPLVFSYKGLSPDTELLDWIATGLVGGVVLFRDNTPHEGSLVESINQMRTNSPGAFRIMVDEEGGDVRRLPNAPSTMRRLRDYEHSEPAEIAFAYKGVAERLRHLGIDTLLAPVVDVGSDSAEWLLPRTLSHDPNRVSAMARAAIPGVQEVGVDCCAKHFPGSRTVTLDTHKTRACSECSMSEWERIDAPPFVSAIASDVAMVMVGHQIMTAFDAVRPACLSPLVVQHLLKERLGFGGLTLTDDLAMKAIAGQIPMSVAVRSSLEAGCDLVLVCNDRTLQRQALAAYEELSVQPNP